MEGATVFYILASQKRQYNNKVEKMISLGPVAYFKKSTNEMLGKISENYKSNSVSNVIMIVS